MNESTILNIIKKITNNGYIGDDCAYLEDLGIVITQDSLVEDIHFKRDWITPYQLGYKSAIVNISDILASGAIPKYLTIALSLPNNLDESFVNEFYSGLKYALNGAEIIGGDITGSKDKIFISVSAIGITKSRNISSRKYAKEGYAIVTSGMFGSSAAGLQELKNNGSNKELILSHLEPKLDYKLSEFVATTVNEPYAMMDTSDGLVDALFKIAESSNVKIEVDYNTVPYLKNIPRDLVLFGGEDYNLVAAIPEKYINKYNDMTVIGKVQKYDGIRLDISGNKYNNYNKLNVFNHFDNI